MASQHVPAEAAKHPESFTYCGSRAHGTRSLDGYFVASLSFWLQRQVRICKQRRKVYLEIIQLRSVAIDNGQGEWVVKYGQNEREELEVRAHTVMLGICYVALQSVMRD
jgi:hypothetical protein